MRIGVARLESILHDELHAHMRERMAGAKIRCVEQKLARRFFGQQSDARPIDPHLFADVAAARFDNEKPFARSELNVDARWIEIDNHPAA